MRNEHRRRTQRAIRRREGGAAVGRGYATVGTVHLSVGERFREAVQDGRRRRSKGTLPYTDNS